VIDGDRAEGQQQQREPSLRLGRLFAAIGADYSLPLAGSRHDACIDAAIACLHMHLHVVRERFSNHPCFPLH
jgi:hypothetical protein